ncbi:cytochrome c553 [Thauera linaloolentis 47Lol = DSM 12138]|uniref:Cytochrome c553 n=2 Tax=Thauera linaloolentis TaxID=76112 RepID=N6Z364_THAL4|nr:cytochrome c553 [Thauera linaloolentis 47Lol = DSM 12138]
MSSAQAVDGSKIYNEGGGDPAAIACATCHGADGRGLGPAGFPRLAGLSPAYLAKQLADFKSGSRDNPVMKPIASALGDEEVKAVVAMLSAMPSPETRHVTRVDLADSPGAVLALRGAWGRNIPECVACHGPGAVGVGDHFPPLAGQSAEYLSAQLNAWRDGSRKNDPNDLMGHIARSMTDEEVSAVAAYFAGLSH